MKTRRLLLTWVLGLGGVLFSAGRVTADDSARAFTAAHQGTDQFPYFSPDIVEAYVVGRSNAANDAKLKGAPPLTNGWMIDPKHYKFCIVEGDRYSVQWIFQSKWLDNGTIQREGTLAFGRVKDGKIISWAEFFDDTVGELQHDGKMGYYSATEEPYPWPEKPGYARPYRTYDPHSATWKNYPDLSRKRP